MRTLSQNSFSHDSAVLWTLIVSRSALLVLAIVMDSSILSVCCLTRRLKKYGPGGDDECQDPERTQQFCQVPRRSTTMREDNHDHVARSSHLDVKETRSFP